MHCAENMLGCQVHPTAFLTLRCRALDYSVEACPMNGRIRKNVRSGLPWMYYYCQDVFGPKAAIKQGSSMADAT